MICGAIMQVTVSREFEEVCVNWSVRVEWEGGDVLAKSLCARAGMTVVWHVLTTLGTDVTICVQLSAASEVWRFVDGTSVKITNVSGLLWQSVVGNFASTDPLQSTWLVLNGSRPPS